MAAGPRLPLRLIFVLCGILAGERAGAQLDGGELTRAIDGEAIRRTVEQLAAPGSRLAGYPGCDAAADYIEQQFLDMGLERVSSEEYLVTVPIDHGASLTLADGYEMPLYGMWPNLVRPPSLPLEGIEGRLIYGGSGSFEDLDGLAVEGSIVLMEYNTWSNWLNPAMLGAQAILFAEPDSTNYIQSARKFLQVPLRTPRFWVDRGVARELRRRLEGDSPLVRLRSRMTWERRPTRNVVAWLPGTDVALRDEVVLIEAYYDGMSVVPAKAPAAEMASGAAALLEIARFLGERPRRRPVVLAATSAHHLALRGMSAFLQRHYRTESHYADLVEEPIDIKLSISLDLSSHTDELGIWNSSTGLYQRRFFAPFGNLFVQLAEEIAPALGRSPGTALYNGITPVGGLTWENLVPGGSLMSSAQLALEAGIPALAFVTVNDARLAVDTPFDRPEQVRFDNLTRQTRLLAGIIHQALDRPDLFPDFRMRLKDQLKGVHGRVLTFPRRSIAPDRPRPGAIVALRAGTGKSVKGVRGTFYELTDERGEFEILGVRAAGVTVQAFYLDPGDGEIIYAPNLGEQAKIYKQAMTLNWWLTESTSILFPCVATDFYELVDPRFLNKLSAVQVYDETNSAPREYGYAIGVGSDEPVGVLFTPPGEQVKLTMSEGLMGIRFMLLNSLGSDSEEQARGVGFPTHEPGAFLRTPYQAARDMWQLNEARIQELRRFAIENTRLAQLHLEARRSLDLAAQALEHKRWSAFMRYSRAALGLEARAYPDVKDTQNDVVHGIVFFMALLIPCAFFAERLLFAFPDIRGQIGGFALVFAVIWIAISMVHPAFELSNPLVVLLAFIILALAVFVLVLLLSRFNAYMRQFSADAVLVHDTDISRLGASYAAFVLGISNMRRRKLRTALTFVTLLLLTFTVLSFTSIQTQLRFSRVRQDHEGEYVGALIRGRTWKPLPESTIDYARADFGQAGTVVPRSWYRPESKNIIPVFRGDRVVQVEGITGLAPDETRVTGADRCLTAGSWFEGERERSCLLPSRLAGLLGLGQDEVGSTYVRIFGERFLVRGVFDEDELDALLDLDGEQLTPVDFTEIGQTALKDERAQEQLQREGRERVSVELVSFTHRPANQTLILPCQLLRELGGSLQSVAVRLDDPGGAQERIESFLSRLAVTLFAGLADEESGKTGVWTYNSIGMTAFGGLGAQFVPALIAALIVLNTMLGAVYERFREISIYSSVGLAPVHISFLFIAEACVYAVLGVVGGYLVGQVTARVLVWQGWLGGISLNYSSLAAVGAAVLVMSVVFLSSLYPARVAARMAVPDVTRRWKLPTPDGDSWEFPFPFTVSGTEVLGLCAFLVAYLKAYSEESLGTFYTQDTELTAVDAPAGMGYEVATRIWLAPFDLGVSQDLALRGTPTGEHNAYEISLSIQRLSGEPISWQRTNQRFVNILRKQFLIWRTLLPAVKEEYRREAEGAGLQVERPC